ncbi:DNA polymerase [Ruminococcus sp.]|uniref:DNA polymerase n=1 Tax=Ruminococcus sp. TaxID=41978 RepID=UPI0025D568D5|nr:DNA polymerase [Ruminococcus sp.]
MQKLMIDLETKSDIDIAKSGVYRYADSPYFDILLFAYSVDDAPVQVVDLACGEQLPEEILNALTDDRIQKHAFNASFERVCLSVWLRRNYPECFISYGLPEDACGNYLNPNAWRCTMVAAAYLGLPLSLAGVGAVLQLQQQKMSEGKALIRYFCVPYDTVNGIPVFHVPTDAPKKWNVFRAYNKRDVETEQAIEQKIARFPVPDFVWQEYALDQTINDRGIQLDLQLVQQAIRMDTLTKDKLLHLLKNLTDLDNPNSVQQMKQWLAEHGLELESLGKKEVQEQLKTAPPDLQAVLLLRQQASKSSVKKYQAMQNAVCSDGRARGMFQFYGANRTGREAGRIIQLQNLPQNHLPDLEDARELVKSGDLEAVELLYEDVPDTLSQLIRTAFVPKPGYKFLVADFSAIEARVIAWLAGETWRMQAFAEDKDIYCASAAKIFGVPVVKHGINGHLRQKGKVAELACIAEGQLVLTDHGLVPIEKVTTDDLLWDGEQWVHHEGVIYKGKREVITYEGLTATPDHLVWIEGQSQPIQFGIAASCGSHLVQTGDGGKAIRLGENYQCGKTLETHSRTARLYDIQNAGRHHRFTVSGKLVHNCGYGGSVGAMKAMGGSEMSDTELKQIVTDWRTASPHIVQLWWDVENAAIKAVRDKTETETHGIYFSYEYGFLFIKLLSGRRLAYVKPRIGENRFGGDSITYEGIGTGRKWERLETYSGKLVENIVQATARDLLFYSMQTLSQHFIVGHIHDEMIIECPKDTKLDEICQQMARTPDWAKGLLLRADGYECSFYKKD